MNKFASFLVFVFGLLVMIVVAVVFAQRYFLPPPPVKEKVNLNLPESNLPPLDLSSKEAFDHRLESIFADGGIEAVKQYVEEQFAPGRKIRVALSPGIFWIVDREIRSCDGSGVAEVGRPPLLPRVSATLRMDDRSGSVESWTRLEKAEPYIVTVWLVRER